MKKNVKEKPNDISQFKEARYLVVYNLSTSVVCTVIRAFLLWRLSYKTYCSNADSVCLLVREMNGTAGRSWVLDQAEAVTQRATLGKRIHLHSATLQGSAQLLN